MWFSLSLEITEARIRLRAVAFLSLLIFVTCKEPKPEDVAKDFQTESGFLYINDEPFIPTGIYFWPDISKPTGRNPFEDIKQYGLNTLVAYYEYIRPDRTITNQPDIDEVQEECDRLGIYFFVGAPTGGEIRNKTDAELEELFSATIDRVADSPHFLGWMFDEPAWNGIDYELMERITQAIRIHSAHPLIWFNFAPVDGRWDQPTWPNMDAYADLADIVSFDFYPVGMGLPWSNSITKSKLEDFGWYADQARLWVDSNTPVWMIQQGYQRGDLGELPSLEDSRRPDSVETRFMTFQAIAHSASGIFYFPGSRLGGAIPFNDPTWASYIKNIVEIIHGFKNFLTSAEPSEGVVVSSPFIKHVVFRFEGKTAIVAVHETNSNPLSVTFTLLETLTGELDVFGEKRTVSVQEGSFSDSFKRYDVHIYISR